MRRLLVVLVVVAFGGVALAQAQQPAQPGGSPMGPGMMQQMGEMMASGQMSADQTKRMGEMMKHMGTMMGGMASMGGGRMGSMGMSEMSKMMERMAEMHKHMSDMMGQPEKK